MIDHDVHLLAAAYAIHAVDDADRASFEAHLGTCELCRAEVDEFRAIHSSMAQTQAVSPPPALKGRVLDEINRIPLKSQSAFLEGLQDRTVTVGKTTYELPAFSFASASPISVSTAAPSTPARVA